MAELTLLRINPFSITGSINLILLKCKYTFLNVLSINRDLDLEIEFTEVVPSDWVLDYSSLNLRVLVNHSKRILRENYKGKLYEGQFIPKKLEINEEIVWEL